MVVIMRDIIATGQNMNKSSVSNKDQDMLEGNVEIRDSTTEPPTPEKVFDLAIGLLHQMGYECVSEDRIEDFTERIDGILRKRESLGDRESSGYLRISSVYRSCQKIHVELYNFLRKFPTDSMEMKEASESLRKLFEMEPSVKFHIHE
nr:hypothetical protein [Candidatus Njordarchaeota archaeon]